MSVFSPKNSIFVGGLSYNTTERDLTTYFQAYSPVLKVILLREPITGISKGYGFIRLKNQKVIQEIINGVHFINGRRVECQVASKKSEKKRKDSERRKRKLFVSRIPINTTNEQIYQLFSQFGELRNCYIIQSLDSKTNKPFGYVEFEKTEDAEHLLERAFTWPLYLNHSKLVIQAFKQKEAQKPEIPLDQSRSFEALADTKETLSSQNSFQGVSTELSSPYKQASPESTCLQITSKGSKQNLKQNISFFARYPINKTRSLQTQTDSNYSFKVALSGAQKRSFNQNQYLICRNKHMRMGSGL